MNFTLKIWRQRDAKSQGAFETYEVKNITGRTLTVAVPEFVQKLKTDPAKGVDGTYIIQSEVYGSGTYKLEPGKSIEFGAAFQAYREKTEKALVPDVKAEYAKRMDYIKNSIDGALVLDTPAKILHPVILKIK